MENKTKTDKDKRGNLQGWKDNLEFMDFISSLGFFDLDLKGRNFTRSNERDHPSMAHHDQFLFSTKWEDLFLASFQKALIDNASDHALSIGV